MAYCTIDDIRNQLDESKLIQLTDDEGTGTVDTARVERAIEDAGEEIDTHVGARYAVPLDPVPPMLRKAAVDIAVYNLYGRREKVPEMRVERYRNALRFLDQVSRGRLSLGRQDPEGNPSESDAPCMSGENPRRAFTRNTLTGF